EPAPLLADARLHRAQRLAVRMAGDEPGGREVAPDRRQILLLHAEQIDALAAGQLHGRHGVFLGDLGDRPQLARRRDAAPDPRHDGVGAVALDVAVRALVDEARLLVVAVLAGPRAQQVEVQRRAALVAAVLGFPLETAHDVRDRLQRVLANGLPHLVVRMDRAAAHRLLRRRHGVVAAERVREELLDEARARTAGGGGLRVCADLVERGQFLRGDRRDDRALRDAVAAAYLGV